MPLVGPTFLIESELDMYGGYSLGTKVMDGGFFGHISATSRHVCLKLNTRQILRPGRTFLA
jgi:hypothetical protein